MSMYVLKSSTIQFVNITSLCEEDRSVASNANNGTISTSLFS